MKTAQARTGVIEFIDVDAKVIDKPTMPLTEIIPLKSTEHPKVKVTIKESPLDFLALGIGAMVKAVLAPRASA